MKVKDIFYGAFLSGVIIALMGYVYLIVGGVVGACLFSTGILLICELGLLLYTGKAGLVPSGDISIKELFWILIFNLFGAWAIGMIGRMLG